MSVGKVRIIGGEWRGRLLEVADLPGLRPTADRTRETLFNCLGQRLDDLICLDMFAGTGALGFEAISRGAKTVQMLELSAKAVEVLKKNKENLGNADHVGLIDIFKVDAIIFGQKLSDKSVDITFIDPPFADEGLFSKALNIAIRITKNNKNSFIYIEHPKTIEPEGILQDAPEYGEFWGIQRTIRSGIAIGTLLAPKPI
jgi:16S rRNA (guanine(966)-N(2))-methyltransferase RsmD